MEYTVDYFIDKFESIPEKRWLSKGGIINKGIFSGIKCCAQGWCLPSDTLYGLLQEKQVSHCSFDLYDIKYLEIISLLEIFKPYSDNPSVFISTINNGFNYAYNQKTAKQRILSALYDIKKLQQPEQPKVKEVIRYVSVSETLKEKATELMEVNN